MIKAVRCSSPTFKTVIFDKGFNVVLAERTKEASDKDSRNGLGKTTLIGIIHFCLGAKTRPNTGLRVEQLKDWTFTLDLKIREQDIAISRNTSDFNRVYLDGDFTDWPIKPEKDENKEGYSLKINELTQNLGSLMFGLPDTTGIKYAPTFRSLISYFVRHGHEAFKNPFEHHAKQQPWDIQINNAYLLGLNWEYATEFQLLKDKNRTLDNLEKASEEGILSIYMGSQGELESEKVRLEEQIKKSEMQLKSFRVHPQYLELQEKAISLTSEIHEVTNRSIINQKIFKKYQENIIEEPDVSIEQFKEIYSEAGLIFPQEILSSLENTIKFHKNIVTNRKAYLQSELERLSRLIAEEKKEIERLSDERAKLFEILQTHGALDEYTLLQKRVIDLKQQVESIRNRIDAIKKIDQGKSDLKIQREELLQKARQDLDERQIQKENAIRFFNQNSERLYEHPGVLSIDMNDTGYRFSVDIQRSRSQGISYMKIFCYDLMLTQIQSLSRYHPGFLIHDSTIFDGVDERQIAKAIELAYHESFSRDFQYICAINSDRIPDRDFSEGFKEKFDRSVRIKLTDATADGGLLGLRF